MVAEASRGVFIGGKLRVAATLTRHAGAASLRDSDRAHGGKLELYRPDAA
jgi:hypothetical protein